MNFIKLLSLSAMLLYCGTVDMSADTTGGTSGNLGSGGEFKPLPKPPGRPKAPSAQVVMASYEDGYVYLNFKYSEGPAALYVFDFDGTTLRSQHMFSTDSEAAVYIGNVSEAYLLVETSNGHEYEGWIY